MIVGHYGEYSPQRNEHPQTQQPLASPGAHLRAIAIGARVARELDWAVRDMRPGGRRSACQRRTTASSPTTAARAAELLSETVALLPL